jgi:hypothetical protein
MISETSKRKINEITDLVRRQEYTFITKNCDMYMVKENGNKHWLCKNKILTEWVDNDYIPMGKLPLSSMSDSFESWVFPSKESAKEHFNDRSFDKEW